MHGPLSRQRERCSPSSLSRTRERVGVRVFGCRNDSVPHESCSIRRSTASNGRFTMVRQYSVSVLARSPFS